MRVLREVGERITAARKTLRYEQRFYCPHDGRMVAAVVPFEGERYLWLVGGRDEHAQTVLADLFEALTDHRDNEDLHRSQASTPDEYDRHHRTLLDAYREVSEAGHSEIPTCAYRLADDYYQRAALLRAAGYDFEPLPHYAPCPRCHRSVVLRVTPGGVTQDP